MDNQQIGSHQISQFPSQLCQARCNNNSRCLNYAEENGYCWLHQPKTASISNQERGME
ncbi:hypothetical protein HYU19_00430 [Candidatus Woesearchaeota archaeon]|nr:hypothetical protein [Candidatus Woesearchaeota archaeon]